MRDDQRRLAHEHASERLPESGRDGHVERCHRLVEKEHAGPGRQGSGDGHALGLPAGDPARAPIRQRRRVDLLEPVPGLRPGPAPAAAGAPRPEGDVVEDRQMGEQQRVLREQGHPALMRSNPCASPLPVDVRERRAVQDHAALGRSQQPGDHGEHGGLPGTVGPEHRHHLDVAHLESDVQSALGHAGVEQQAHSAPRLCRVRPITPTATTTRTSESATAASAAVSRWR